MRGVDIPLPSIREVIDQTIQNGKLTNKQIQCIGIALNTSNCQSEASDHKDRLSKEYDLPCLDPLQDNLDPFIRIIKNI